jgi:transposase
MLIIGCDYHPSVQQIAWADTETGECGEKRLMHSDGEAERFYRELKQKGVQVRVGIEATGHSRWFECLLAELGFELWVGNAAEIRAARVRKQRNDRRDAKHILKLLMEDRFPKAQQLGQSASIDLVVLIAFPHGLVFSRIAHYQFRDVRFQ